MPKYRWLLNGEWVPCTQGANRILSKRAANPTLQPLLLSTEHGVLVGTPGYNALQCVHDDDTCTMTQIRECAAPDQVPLYAILQEHGEDVLSPEASEALFTRDGLRTEGQCTYGMQTFHIDDGQLFQGDEPRRWKKTDLSHADFRQMTQARYTWQFKGPLRQERMATAVQQLIDAGDADTAVLARFYEDFDPEADTSEYGGTQFPDYLIAFGYHALAIRVAEAFNRIPLDEWRDFDPVSNLRIERARGDGQPVAVVQADGQLYTVIFDSGAGASGKEACLVRPTRYAKILESIEEQFHTSQMARRETILSTLFDELEQQSVHPEAFLISYIRDADSTLDLFVPDGDARQRVRLAMQRLYAPNGHLSTRLQQFMPALMDKFKECEIRMSTEERLDVKPCCPLVAATLDTGLSVPLESNCLSLSEVMHFVQKTQSWKLPRGKHTCDICSQRRVTTLTHCGNAHVCLKCWSGTLSKSNMACPFCRQTVENGTLKRSPDPVKVTAPRKSLKRKRKRTWTEQGILEEIHKHDQYNDVTPASTFDMRKWFTILLRSRLVRIHQMPKKQGKQSFRAAMAAFNLLSHEM